MFSPDHIHNQLIHFPIALLSASFLFDIAALILKNDKLITAGWYTLILGVMFGLAAIITGFIADQLYGHMRLPFPLFTTHGAIQMITWLCFFGLAVFRYSPKRRFSTLSVWYYFIGLLAVVVLFYGSYLGAVLAGRI